MQRLDELPVNCHRESKGDLLVLGSHEGFRYEGEDNRRGKIIAGRMSYM